MFDIGWQELFIVGVLALIVVGPKDLPRVLRTATQAIGKARALAREFQNGVNEVVREADLDDIRKQVDAQKWDVDKALETALDHDGLAEQLDIDDSAAGLDLEKDYQERKKAAAEKARKELEAEEVESTQEFGPAPEPADHELDSGDDDDDEPAEAEPIAEADVEAAPEKTPEPAPKA